MTRRGSPGHLTRPSRGAFFPAASGKLLLSLPAAQVPTRISPPRQQANAAEADTAAESADSNSLSCRAVDCPDSSPAPAADSADFVGAADSNTAPTVSQPALDGIGSSPPGKRVIDAGNTSGHEAPHFSPSVAAALISPAVSSACPLDEFSCLAWTVHRPAHVRRKICAADFPPCWHGCRCPLVWTNSLSVKPWTVNRPDSESAPAADSAEFAGSADS